MTKDGPAIIEIGTRLIATRVIHWNATLRWEVGTIFTITRLPEKTRPESQSFAVELTDPLGNTADAFIPLPGT